MKEFIRYLRRRKLLAVRDLVDWLLMRTVRIISPASSNPRVELLRLGLILGVLLVIAATTIALTGHGLHPGWRFVGYPALFLLFWSALALFRAGQVGDDAYRWMLERRNSPYPPLNYRSPDHDWSITLAGTFLVLSSPFLLHALNYEGLLSTVDPDDSAQPLRTGLYVVDQIAKVVLLDFMDIYQLSFTDAQERSLFDRHVSFVLRLLFSGIFVFGILRLSGRGKSTAAEDLAVADLVTTPRTAILLGQRASRRLRRFLRQPFPDPREQGSGAIFSHAKAQINAIYALAALEDDAVVPRLAEFAQNDEGRAFAAAQGLLRVGSPLALRALLENDLTMGSQLVSPMSSEQVRQDAVALRRKLQGCRDGDLFELVLAKGRAIDHRADGEAEWQCHLLAVLGSLTSDAPRALPPVYVGKPEELWSTVADDIRNDTLLAPAGVTDPELAERCRKALWRLFSSEGSNLLVQMTAIFAMDNLRHRDFLKLYRDIGSHQGGNESCAAHCMLAYARACEEGDDTAWIAAVSARLVDAAAIRVAEVAAILVADEASLRALWDAYAEPIPEEEQEFADLALRVLVRSSPLHVSVASEVFGRTQDEQLRRQLAANLLATGLPGEVAVLRYGIEHDDLMAIHWLSAARQRDVDPGTAHMQAERLELAQRLVAACEAKCEHLPLSGDPAEYVYWAYHYLERMDLVDKLEIAAPKVLRRVYRQMGEMLEEHRQRELAGREHVEIHAASIGRFQGQSVWVYRSWWDAVGRNMDWLLAAQGAPRRGKPFRQNAVAMPIEIAPLPNQMTTVPRSQGTADAVHGWY